jgi:4-aminobutyrate aminotransferase
VYETVRFIPALNISAEDLAKGIRILREAVDEVIQEALLDCRDSEKYNQKS